MSCVICNAQATERRVNGTPHGTRAKYRNILICDRCDSIRRRKPSPSLRGRQKNRLVPAPTSLEWIEALRRSWNITGNCFRCEISGLKLCPNNSHSPLSISCDHDPPGSGNYLVVAWVINDMKNDHDKTEFLRNVGFLAKILMNGSPDTKLADKYEINFSNLRYWKRK